MRIAPFSQGLYYVATGLWPIVHLRSFMKVTGPKQDTWLVRTFGALTAAVGGALLLGAFEPRRKSLSALGIGAAAALGAADAIYAGKRRISRVYFGDAAAEAAVIGTWILTERR